MLKWHTQRLSDGRWYTNNGKITIWANSLKSLQRLVRKYRYNTGCISQRADGSVHVSLFK